MGQKGSEECLVNEIGHGLDEHSFLHSDALRWTMAVGMLGIWLLGLPAWSWHGFG
jgi:hypothetical protein